ncbi:hypothetical protein PHET_03823 [Paragonimus heterotremus]|uniref:Ig-like domain-containing protein n=1 Tax=Paragonimus heterotremus TaxID=100268 RepID=A0A8J4WJN9_9TREM|nr:hypothetical protein PHET_03823 [Paragonimus heterotremus]
MEAYPSENGRRLINNAYMLKCFYQLANNGPLLSSAITSQLDLPKLKKSSTSETERDEVYDERTIFQGSSSSPTRIHSFFQLCNLSELSGKPDLCGLFPGSFRNVDLTTFVTALGHPFGTVWQRGCPLVSTYLFTLSIQTSEHRPPNRYYGERLPGIFVAEALQYVEPTEANAEARLYGNSHNVPRSKAYNRQHFRSQNSNSRLNMEEYRDYIEQYSPQNPDEVMLPDVPRYIIQPPAVLYTYKNKPALVTCKVKPAVLLYVICADNLTGTDSRNRKYPAEHDRHSHQQYLQPTDINSSMLTYKTSQIRTNLLQQSELVKTFTSSDSKQVTRIVTAKAVEKWFGEFWCQCEAWNNVQELGEPRVITSPRTSVQLAFLNKRFVRHPKSIRVVLGWPAEFFCQAPNGRPKPKLQWMKDGKRIENGSVRIKILHTLKLNESDNSTQQHEHHQFNTSSDEPFDEGAHAISWLIIRSTEIEDEGVYTCVATNEAGRRTSNQARLTIHGESNECTAV